MKRRHDLHRKIRECLSEGSELSEHIYTHDDQERRYVFRKEIDGARRWMANINSIPEQEILEKMPKIVELIRECARVVENDGIDLWVEEFESVADEIEEALKLVAIDEEAKVGN